MPQARGVLGMLFVEQRRRSDRVRQPVLLELFDPGQPHVLVVGVAGQVELQHVLDTGVVGHVVQPCGLDPALRLGRDIRVEIGEEVSTGHYVSAVPRHPVAVGQRRPASGDDGLLRVHSTQHRGDHGIGGRFLSGAGGGSALEQPCDHGGDHFHVPDFLGGHVHDHVLVLARHSAVPSLEQVLHGDGHLAVRAADQLLEFACVHGVGLFGLDVELQIIGMAEHRASTGVERFLVRTSSPADTSTLVG